MIFLDKILVRKKTFLKVLLIAIFVEIAFGLGFFFFYHGQLYPTVVLPFYLILYFYVVKRRRSFVNFPLMSLEGLLFICITLNVPIKFSSVVVYLFLLLPRLWFLFWTSSLNIINSLDLFVSLLKKYRWAWFQWLEKKVYDRFQ